MNILRRATTRQLIIAIVVIVALAAGSAVALAGGDGPKPPHRSLAAALHHAAAAQDQAVPSVAHIQRAFAKIAQHADLSGAIPGDIAGRPAYTVRVSPRHSGGLLGSVQLAWDAAHGIPLRIAIYSRSDASPVLSLTVTDISYGAVPSSDLAVHLAPGTKIVRVHPPQHMARPAGMRTARHPAGTGEAAGVGTLIQFDRGGVRYTVVGSLPSAAAVIAARGIG